MTGTRCGIPNMLGSKTSEIWGTFSGADSRTHLEDLNLEATVTNSTKSERYGLWHYKNVCHSCSVPQPCKITMFRHEFIVDNFTVWVNVGESKLEAFASICPVSANQFMVSAFILNFPRPPPLDCKELDNLPRPPTGIVRVVRRPMGPLPPKSAIPLPQCPKARAAMLLGHEHVLPPAVLQTLDPLRPGAGCSMVALRQQELLHLPAVDYSLSNSRLLAKLCHLLLQKSATPAVQGRRDPPPQQANLTLGLYADGYQPGGRPNVDTKICIIDFVGDWFPRSGHVPRCTDMRTWMELPKLIDGKWLPKRAEALQAPPSCKFNQRMKYGGAQYTTTLHVQFGCLIADHYHLWSECRRKRCVACPWVNKHGASTLFLHNGGHPNDVRGCHKFHRVSNVAEIYIMQSLLHNTKGGASRLLGVIGRPVPGPCKHELLKVIAQVARIYHPGSLPPDTREHQRLVRGRFQAGISLTGREARTVMGRLAGCMVLPLPFHSLHRAFCHIRHSTPVLRLHYIGNYNMASYGFGVHIYCAHDSGICGGRLHCKPICAWVVPHLV